MGVLETNPLITAVVLLHLLSLLAAVSAKLKTSHIQFDYFNDTYNLGKAFQVDSPATIHNDALQITPDSVNSPFLANVAGRIMYKHPFTLWKAQNGTRVGSFNASFLVNLYRVGNSTPGEGLAFVVAPDLNLPPNSSGKYLGLTNSATDGKAANSLVAVELDTYKEHFDPDSNHVGLNINSVKSNITTSLTPLGFQLVGAAGTANFFNVWIQYDGIEKTNQLSTAAVLLHLLSLLAAVSAKLKTSEIQFDYFNDTYNLRKAFQVDSPATIHNDALQITPDSVNSPFLANVAGRIMYKHPFTLWKAQNGTRVGSFNASFLVNLYRVGNSTPGEGLAFVVAPDLNLPPNSSGKYLGLTNSATDGKAENSLVAVELDTYKEHFDPDSNHVGLNINSVKSNITTSLTPLGFQLVGEGSTANFFNVWVQYDGRKKVINVYITQQENETDPTPSRPADPILRSNLDLKGVVNQKSYFGFSASTSSAIQLNCVRRWNLTVEHYHSDKPKWVKIGLAVGIPTVVLVPGLVVLVYYVRKMMSARRLNHKISGELKSMPGIPKEYEYKDLQKATNNFDEKMKLGQGGFGVVYKGILEKGKLEVAVKVFSKQSLQGQDDFLTELKVINRLRHKNLLQLRGWCHKHRDQLMLIFDYMPNGSLDKQLFGDDANIKPLSWDLRHKIISGVASALHSLQCHFEQRVIHRDVKASNIMLDSDFTAKLGDFGLAQSLDNERTSYGEASSVCGTRGYMAPEYVYTGMATEESDVYAFGAVILEVVCGKKPMTQIDSHQFLVDWVWALHHEGRVLEAVDNRLGKDYAEEEAQRVLLLGMACSHPLPSKRPKTHDIVQILSGSMRVPHVPSLRPPFVWAYNTPAATDTTSFMTAPCDQSTSTSPMAINSETQRLFFMNSPQCISEMTI